MNDGHSPRSVVLQRIRAALNAAPSEPVVVPRDYRRGLPPGVDLVGLFVERVTEYRATVHRASTESLPRVIGEILTEAGVRRLVVPMGVPEAWLADAPGIQVLRDRPPLDHAHLDAADATLSGCALAIAETGTVVLDAAQDQGRRALTLLPDRHLCVVGTNQIVGDVSDALVRLNPSRPLTWISGPSATSDIELQRIEGVHGPRELHILVVAHR